MSTPATGASEARPPRSSHLGRGALLAAAVATISGLHYLTDPQHAVWHQVYQRLYYLPVIVGAYWYGVWGGVLTAMVTSVAYVPHIHMAWSGNAAYSMSQYAEMVMFHVAGVLVGLLANLQRRLTTRYQRAAESLEKANVELRESHEQLLRADRLSALGEIAAGLAHELRNPLASVKGALEIVAARVPPGTPESEFSTVGQKELARLDFLLTEFLTYARPHAPELRKADLDDVMDHVAALLGPEAERAGVAIEIEREQAISEVLVDPEQIQQVFFNVMLNSIQATPPGARVRVRRHQTSDGIIVEVMDDGPGIPAGHLSRIFDPFFTTKEKGTGLGLAISARIVAAHGGDISAQRGPDRGTCVRITLPWSPLVGETTAVDTARGRA
jgi:signal transduction histidine kinase